MFCENLYLQGIDDQYTDIKNNVLYINRTYDSIIGINEGIDDGENIRLDIFKFDDQLPVICSSRDIVEVRK